MLRRWKGVRPWFDPAVMAFIASGALAQVSWDLWRHQHYTVDDAAASAVGLWAVYQFMGSWWYRRSNPGLMRAVRDFKEAVKALDPAVLLYVDDETHLVFSRFDGRRLGFLYRWTVLYRTPEDAIMATSDELDDSGAGYVTAESFEIRSASPYEVFHTFVGGRLILSDTGEPTPDRSLGRQPYLRTMLSRHRSLRAGLLVAGEQELREVVEQLARVRPYPSVGA
jgi:hypothetical protein